MHSVYIKGLGNARYTQLASVIIVQSHRREMNVFYIYCPTLALKMKMCIILPLYIPK